ncbi:MAG: FAD-binding oxidoreductase, partial [Actinomycetota bacterium]|nr:FAD-binding oxidoreductase [Actinomycetota bacterium]
MTTHHDGGGHGEELVRSLRSTVKGGVRFDDGARALYATDASNYRQVPIGVVTPRDVDDVLATLAACREHGAPVLSRGGGTSLAGQCCNRAVVMDFSRHMNQVVSIDPAGRRAVVQPGVVLDVLRDRAEEHGLTFGPDPSTHNRCTLGGMIGNNSCGVHSVTAGRTAENIEELEVVTYDGLRLRVGRTSDDELAAIVAAGGRRGEIYAGLRSIRDRYGELIRGRYPKLPRRVSGYNLDELLPENGCNVARALVGTEGTCVVVLGATTRLVPSPPTRVLLVIGFPDVFDAADAVPLVLEHGVIGLEGLDEQLVNDIRTKGGNTKQLHVLPKGGGWLLAEFGADTAEEAEEQARVLMEELDDKGLTLGMRLLDDPDEEERLWLLRESGLGATASVSGRADTWEGWEDSAVPPDQLGAYLREFKALLEEHGHDTAALYGHFGDGCVHTRIDFNLRARDGIADFRAFAEEATDLVLRHGGSLSGEHGDGQSRAELLPRMFGAELVRAFGEFKGLWDPDGWMNPGKVVDPYRLDENLRLGPRYNPIPVTTTFSFREDEGSFARATLRCVGVGLCRREEGGTMCPSYMATREEEHSTRGRARLLYEMLEGDVVTDVWQDEHVKDALDLCLACKGCKSDCPVGVDMATYKAEFFSHYYEGHRRPRSAYTIGLIHRWAGLAARAPRLANLAVTVPGLGTLAKRAAGVHPRRKVPSFAPRTFRAGFVPRRPAPGAGGQRVILWPDTFNDAFNPAALHAAADVLEAAGFAVDIPPTRLCCGRPLYDYGFLGQAKSLLRRVLEELAEDIAAGVPLVGLEPSCVAVFRDELRNLFPHDQDAERLCRQTLTLSELLERHAPDW